MTAENLLHQVKEIEITYSEKSVNDLLSDGWILLSVASGQEQTGSNDYTPVFKFCLGKPE
jgi:hypothetical protein